MYPQPIKIDLGAWKNMLNASFWIVIIFSIQIIVAIVLGY
jgi:hypothetical protein